MDAILAIALGERNRGKDRAVFDWDKAARLIKERKPKYAKAGLKEDWMWTGGYIYRDGAIDVDDYTYLASSWATPQLILDGEAIDCYVRESRTQWDEHTQWPQSALDILKDGET